MRLFGIDIGGRNTLIGEWSKDRYGLSADGISACLQNDSGKPTSRYLITVLSHDSRTVVLFSNKEVSVCDHVGSKVLVQSFFHFIGCLCPR